MLFLFHGVSLNQANDPACECDGEDAESSLHQALNQTCHLTLSWRSGRLRLFCDGRGGLSPYKLC